MKDKIKMIIISEWNLLKGNLKKEIKYIFSLSFKEYLLNLLFPKNYGYFLIFLRITTLYVVIKFVFDSVLFILKILFDFYFIILERIFEVVIKLNQLFFGNWFFFSFFFKIIKFFKYIFLCMFFVNLAAELRRKQIPLWLHIFEKVADFLIKIIKTPIKWRYIFYPILKIIEIILVIIHFILAIFAGFIDNIWTPLYRIVSAIIYVRVSMIYRYLYIVWKYKKKGKYHLNNMLLFHISTDLQQKGFVGPECEDHLIWIKAKLDYKRYRRKFLNAELTPDVVDDAGLNIYIYLKSLLKDTRYQRKNIGFFDVIIVIFPYTLLSDLFFAMIFFFMGIIYIFYFLLWPIIGLYVGLRIMYVIYDLFEFVYMLCFKDLDLYLIKVKKTEVRNKKIKKKFDKILNFFSSKIKKITLFFKNNFKLFKINLKKIFNEFIAFCKKIYEKIFR